MELREMEGRPSSDAVHLMMRYAHRTGLDTDRPSRRYLWTDAFAVCNFLGLARATGDGLYEELALRLASRVHQELGSHRPDDARTGWLSGLSGAEAEAHPTRGGLRIGKPLPERAASEPYDANLEWERDGQYFHYLTKWMHALDQIARATKNATFNVWARELAETAHRAFAYGPPANRRMVWKLSIDLSRPLVASMGQHDPLDGFVTCVELEATAAALRAPEDPKLTTAASDFAQMMAPTGFATGDPLGIGGLLVDASRLAQRQTRPDLLAPLLAGAVTGLRHFVRQPDLRAPAHRRLAFRELGLAIGLASVARIDAGARAVDAKARASLSELAKFTQLRAELEAFWLLPHHRETSAWLEHADINEVMLATSLEPAGFLDTLEPLAPLAPDERAATPASPS